MERTYYPIDDRQARIAHDMNSMREFRSDEAGYRAEVDEVWGLAEAKAREMPEVAEQAYRLAHRFALKYAAWLNEGYAIDSMCPSILISGGANFPTKKKERQNARRDSHMAKYDEIKAIRSRIARLGTGGIQSDDPEAIAKLTAKAERLEARQEAMKEANRWFRKYGCLAGFTCDVEGVVSDALLDYGRGYDIPFPPYALSNNLANIKRTRERIAQLEREKEAPRDDRETTVNREPCRVVENAEAMRLQLLFEDKPEPETRDLLKRNGFRWSPKNGAWQRQLTDNARRALRNIEG